MQLLCKNLESPGYKMAQFLFCVPLTDVHEALMKICHDLIVLGVMVVLTEQLWYLFLWTKIYHMLRKDL